MVAVLVTWMDPLISRSSWLHLQMYLESKGFLPCHLLQSWADPPPLSQGPWQWPLGGLPATILLLFFLSFNFFPFFSILLLFYPDSIQKPDLEPIRPCDPLPRTLHCLLVVLWTNSEIRTMAQMAWSIPCLVPPSKPHPSPL